MLFNSAAFLVFFVLVFVVYWFLSPKTKHQNFFLLISSYVFYGWWDWRFLSLILFSSFVDFYLGAKIFHEKSTERRKKLLLLSLIANLGLLGIFKYYNFFATSFATLATQFGWQPNDLTLNIILPVGISFYTFQTLSYTIDIFRGTLHPAKSLMSFCTYIAFFPQLVAGPIERASNLLSQIEKKRIFSIDSFKQGLFQIVIGLVRKVVIADTLGGYVDTIYNNPEIYNSSTIFLATFFYAFQIYYDFAGYSDIAIGSANLLGFKFRQNFDLPYFSNTLTQFWRKWHMSLSFWLRDYLYIPLGGNRNGILITYRNLMLTMLLGGLWHGSSWNFIIWGGLHGTALGIEKFLDDNGLLIQKKIPIFGFIVTFSLILLSWIFFRTPDISTALTVICTIFVFDLEVPYTGDLQLITNSIFVLSIGIIFDLVLLRLRVTLEELGSHISSLYFYIVICLSVALLNLFHSTSENFIYFQF